MNCPLCKCEYESEKQNCPFCGTKNPEFAGQKKSGDNRLIYLAGGLIAVVTLPLLYFFVIKPAIIDSKAERLYVIANNLKLRSSEYIDVSNSNVVKEIPFGSEVLVYEKNNEWAKVKVNKLKGYMGSPNLYLKDKRSFYEIDAMFGNDEARQVVRSVKIKIALLEYFRNNMLYGKLPESVKKEYNINLSDESVWQTFGMPEGVTYNILVTGFFLGSEEECEAVIIQNQLTAARRLLIFSFIEDTPTFRFQMEMPSGYDGMVKVPKTRKIFTGKILKGKEVLERPLCEAIEFGSNDVFNITKKAILVFNGTEFTLHMQP